MSGRHGELSPFAKAMMDISRVFFAAIAAIFLIVLSSAALAQETTQLVEARQRIARGSVLGEEGDYEAALVEFSRARELLQGHPRQFLVDYNIGTCYEGLFQYDRAIQFYRSYLSGAGHGAGDAAEVQSRITQLEGRLGTIRLTVNASDYQVWIDGHFVGRNLSQVMTPSGRHTVEIRADGHLQGRQEIELPARSEVAVAIELERLVRLHPALFWASLGLALASGGVCAGFGGYALGEHSDLQELSDDPVQSWLVRPEDNERIDRLALVSDVFLGVGVLFAVSTLVLGLFTDWRRNRRAPRLSTAVGPSSVELGLGGTF